MIIVGSVAVFLAALVAFTVSHIVLSLRVRRFLQENHEAAWEAFVESMADRQGSIAAFVWSGRHRALNAPDLTRRVMLIRWLTIGIVVAMLGAIFGWMPVEAILGGSPAP